MRVVIAPDRLAGVLTARQAADALSLGWSVGAPHDRIDCVPLTDGGPGFLDELATAHPGELLALTGEDPWGRATPAAVLLCEEPAGRTAYLEAAQVCGAQLRRPGDPLLDATSTGLGRLVAAALDAGARRVVVGLTGAVVPDGGLGLIAGLAGEPPGALGAGPAGLAALDTIDLGPLTDCLERVRGVTLTALGDLHQPLLGLQGVAATQVPDRAEGQQIEAALGHALDVVRRVRRDPVDLVTGAALRAERTAGAGAGGGLGLGILLAGGQVLDGPALGAELVGLPAAMAAADLLVGGTAVLGWEALRGSPVTAAATLAQARGIPVVVIAGQLSAGRRETMAAGINGAYAACAGLRDWSAFTAEPAARLAARAESVARTWSPRP
ncbi:MAG TPA: glycerate kinase [Dermatophilaceae bacterium]|mgnify:CR=1 FL=1|nr:glycerate kinase [Dermatophilaceae bacterium]